MACLPLQMALLMQADTQRADRNSVGTMNSRPLASINQRRSQRILLSIHLLVSGKRANGATFNERASTVVVNAHGALLLLHEPVLVGQVLTLNNVATTEEIVCTVVDINQGSMGGPEIGIEFAQPCPRFWRVSFPPSDWSPRSPEAKRIAQPKPLAPPASTPPLVKKL
jgi:hypothetical protein